MALTEEHATWFAKTFTMIVENVAKALLGKEEVIRLALTAMLGICCWRMRRAPVRRRWPGRWRPVCRARTRAFSSPRICFPVISPG